MININSLIALAALGTYRGQSNRVVENTEKISFSVYNPGDKVFIVPEMNKAIKEDETVLQVSARILEEKKIPYTTAGIGEDKYIQSIGALGQGTKGPQSGWLYKVNGKFPDDAPNDYELDNGDQVEWVYTVNAGKDVGVDLTIMQRKNNFHVKVPTRGINTTR